MADAAPATKKASKPRPKAEHPPYITMVQDAISTLKERSGSSLPAIKKFIGEKYGSKLKGPWEKTLSHQLKKLADAGKLKKVKASYKLGDELKAKPKKKPAAKKPKAEGEKKAVAKAKKPTKPKAPKAEGEKKKKAPAKPKAKKPAGEKKAKTPKAKKPAAPKVKTTATKKAAPKKPAAAKPKKAAPKKAAAKKA